MLKLPLTPLPITLRNPHLVLFHTTQLLICVSQEVGAPPHMAILDIQVAVITLLALSMRLDSLHLPHARPMAIDRLHTNLLYILHLLPIEPKNSRLLNLEHDAIVVAALAIGGKNARTETSVLSVLILQKLLYQIFLPLPILLLICLS